MGVYHIALLIWIEQALFILPLRELLLLALSFGRFEDGGLGSDGFGLFEIPRAAILGVVWWVSTSRWRGNGNGKEREKRVDSAKLT